MLSELEKYLKNLWLNSKSNNGSFFILSRVYDLLLENIRENYATFTLVDTVLSVRRTYLSSYIFLYCCLTIELRNSISRSWFY